MKTFNQLLVNSLLVAAKNNFIWFALTFFVYLETRSVISTSIVGGTFLVMNAVSAFWLGSIVDHHKKKSVLVGSNLATLAFFGAAYGLYVVSPETAFQTVNSVVLWLFGLLLLLGVISGSIYHIAMPTLVTILVDEDKRDKANGMLGTVMGLSFALTSVASGTILGFWGMKVVLIVAIVATMVAVLHTLTIKIKEDKVVVSEEHKPGKVDVKGTLAEIRKTKGLGALIILTTFNNLLGGVFMALMDAYGLSLVPVQVWGLLFGGLSFAFIFGGIYISKKGLGENPLRNLFKVYTVLWLTCIFFTIQPSIILLALGAIVWMALSPFIEATEQTIIQKVVPQERQGRVFGFAHSVEQAASPLTAFLIGPIAQYIFIPFMTTGAGVELIGGWFGVGEGRGIALVFMASGMVGLVMTMIASRARAFKLLYAAYKG